MVAFSLAHPKELDERQQAPHQPHVRQAAPVPGPIACDKGFAGAGVEAATAGPGDTLVRPALEPEKKRVQGPKRVPGWLRQRIAALNAAIWHNWPISAPLKRSLIPYDHRPRHTFPINDLGHADLARRD